MKVRFLKVARAELLEAVVYYNERSPGLGEELANEVERTLSRIRRSPLAWPPLSDRARRCRTRRFPYGVIYQVRDQEILVLAIAHSRRHPDYWHDRLTK